MCAAKARLEFKLASAVKDKRKGFLKYVNRKRRIRESVGPLLDEVGHLTNRGVEKGDMFNAAFASGFNGDGGPWEPGRLCWETATGRDDKLPANSELSEACCSARIHQSLWGPMGFVPGS